MAGRSDVHLRRIGSGLGKPGPDFYGLLQIDQKKPRRQIDSRHYHACHADRDDRMPNELAPIHSVVLRKTPAPIGARLGTGARSLSARARFPKALRPDDSGIAVAKICGFVI
jgi:hypothetical protein